MSTKMPELKGNDSYQNNFTTVTYNDEKQNGLEYGEPYLWVKCPKAIHYVSGALYKKAVNGSWEIKQVDMAVDKPETEKIENVCRFELFKPNRESFDVGEYMIKIVADGTNSWTDEFVIAES